MTKTVYGIKIKAIFLDTFHYTNFVSNKLFQKIFSVKWLPCKKSTDKQERKKKPNLSSIKFWLYVFSPNFEPEISHSHHSTSLWLMRSCCFCRSFICFLTIYKMNTKQRSHNRSRSHKVVRSISLPNFCIYFNTNTKRGFFFSYFCKNMSAAFVFGVRHRHLKHNKLEICLL